MHHGITVFNESCLGCVFCCTIWYARKIGLLENFESLENQQSDVYTSLGIPYDGVRPMQHRIEATHILSSEILYNAAPRFVQSGL